MAQIAPRLDTTPASKQMPLEDHPPAILEYALALLATLTLLVIVCTPSRRR
jgi:hypothetical protein